MRTWFVKQSQDIAAAHPPAVELTTGNELDESSTITTHKTRRMIYAPVISAESVAAAGDTIRIKAQVDPEGRQVVLMIDRPVLRGYSYYSTEPGNAELCSPLAATLLKQAGVSSVLIHEKNVTVSFAVASDEPTEVVAKRFGHLVRTHMETGQSSITESFLARMPSEDEIRERLQEAIDDEIGPGISGHSGEITITAIVGNTAYIKMGGGCQGCAASGITLRQGVDKSFRSAVPQLGALLDETDHSAGNNPFFTELPAEMSA